MKRHLILPLAACLAIGQVAPAGAQNKPVSALTPRGTPVASDQIPVLPTGATSLLSSTAADVANYVLTSVKAYGAKGDGVTDDTAAIQAAINSGLSVYFPPGIYKTTATLTVQAPQNDGQILRGAGSWGLPDSFNGSTGYGAAVIKPTSSVTKAIMIDGTPFVGGGYQQSWVQGFGIENIAIDMANMSDVSTNAAINQIQAWDCHYTNIRVRNDGANKRAWLYSPGAFTTSMLNTQGHIIDMEGASSSYGVTTITITNHNGGRIIGNYAVNLRVVGGAFQGYSETKFYFRNYSSAIWLATDVEGTGTYLDVDTSVSQLHTDSQLQGFSGTYMNGTPGNSAINTDQQTNFNAYPFNLTWGSINLNNQGTGSYYNRSSFLSGSNSQQEYLYIGRAGGESFWGVAAATNDFVSGSAAGDTVVGSNNTGEATWIAAAGMAAAKATSTGFYTFGGGTINEAASNTGYTTATALVAKPATDGQLLTLENVAGTPFMICSSNSTIGASNCGVGNGSDWKGFSDGFVTQTYDFDASSGNGSFSGTVSGSALIISGTISGAAFVNYLKTPPAIGGTTPSTGAFSTLTISSTVNATGVITATKGIVSVASTIAGLPSSPIKGQSGFVTDAAACNFNSAVTGGGANNCPVVFNGTSWVAG